MPNIPDVAVEIPSVDQVAIVVEDLEDGMERYAAILGVAPWNVYAYEPPVLSESTYRGDETEYGMELAISYAGDMMVELIEPTIDPNIYTDFLDAHGEGLHHIACFSFDDPYAVVEAFEAAGIPVVQSGFAHGASFWYFDTAEHLNGLIFETGDRAVRDAPLPAPDAVYPPDAEPLDL